MAYIYKISNDINDKVYIGKTIYTPEKRLVGHLCTAFYPKMKNNKFATAIREIGREHFKTESIEECEDEVAGDREKYWIEYYDSFENGYNSSHGGERSNIVDREIVIQYYKDLRSQKLTAEELGISAKTVERILDAEKIDKLSRSEISKESGFNKFVDAYTLDGKFVKHFEAIMDGCRWLVETNQVTTTNPRTLSGHISSTANGKKNSAYGYIWKFSNDNDYCNNDLKIESSNNYRGKKRSIYMLDKDTLEVLQSFESASDAGRFLGDVKRNKLISACAHGKRKTAYGYKWKFMN